jgi:hypothetical protein
LACPPSLTLRKHCSHGLPGGAFQILSIYLEVRKGCSYRSFRPHRIPVKGTQTMVRSGNVGGASLVFSISTCRSQRTNEPFVAKECHSHHGSWTPDVKAKWALKGSSEGIDHTPLVVISRASYGRDCLLCCGMPQWLHSHILVSLLLFVLFDTCRCLVRRNVPAARAVEK